MAFPSRLVKSMSLFPAAARSAAASCAQPFHPRSTAANLFVCRLPKAIGFLLVAATLIGTTATADAQLQASEPALTAAYLEKFAGFVECPPGTFKTDTAPIVIGVVDADAVRDQLAEVARDRFLGKRVIEVARVDNLSLPTPLHMLFVSSIVRPDRAKLVEDARRAHVLVVTADPSGLHPGSALNFVTVERRLRFEASLAEADREGVKLSSRLLGVAIKVEAGTP